MNVWYFCGMKWIGERVSFEDDKGVTTIVIRPEDKVLEKGLMGAWVAMWMTIGVIMVWSYFTFDLTQQEEIIVCVFMAFWAYYAFKVSRSFVWLMWGKELIKINEASLTYKRSVKRYGKAVPYYLENIKKMKLEFPDQNSIQKVWESSPWVNGGERFEFEYLGKVIRFGRKLNEKDAKLLFNVLTKRIEDQLKRRNNKGM